MLFLFRLPVKIYRWCWKDCVSVWLSSLVYFYFFHFSFVCSRCHCYSYRKSIGSRSWAQHIDMRQCDLLTILFFNLSYQEFRVMCMACFPVFSSNALYSCSPFSVKCGGDTDILHFTEMLIEGRYYLSLVGLHSYINITTGHVNTKSVIVCSKTTAPGIFITNSDLFTQ